jgi:hypothetical protein
MQFARLRLVLPIIACVLASSDAAEVQEKGQEGSFMGVRSSLSPALDIGDVCCYPDLRSHFTSAARTVVQSSGEAP